jgi:uncharacterized protein (TIGR03437 family)
MLPLAALALSIPLHFEPNRGQAQHGVRYVAAAQTYVLFLSDTGIAMNFPNGGSLRMNLPSSSAEALDALPGKTNYYLGSDTSAWHTNIPNYARVRYRGVYPGIDLVVYGKQRRIEYDWMVAPGADPASIRFSFTGASGIRVDESGDLVLDTAGGEIRERKPYVYQRVNGQVREIQGSFVIARHGSVRFRVGVYDKRRPLVIDPQLEYAVGFGGIRFPKTGTGTSIAADRNGNTYIAGYTASSDFPLVHPLEPAPPQPCPECGFMAEFVAKLSADGSELLYSTYLSVVVPPNAPGLFFSLPAAVAVDANGNAFVTGTTTGLHFPQLGNVSPGSGGGNDAFVVKLDTNGNLVASQLFGGSADDVGTSIALGPDGGLYVAGTTASVNFPTSMGAYRNTGSGSQEMFLMKLDPRFLVGSQLNARAVLYSTYLGQGGPPFAGADSLGNGFVAASTTSAAWSTSSGAVQPHCAGSACADAIIMKVDPTGGNLLYATYLGGSGTETVGGIAVDASGSAYISGTTTSTDFRTTGGAFQIKWTPVTQVPTPQTAFVAKLSPDATKLVYATYLGGTLSEQGQGIAVDSAGNAYVGGATSSSDFPILNAIQVSPYNRICFYGVTHPGLEGFPTSEGYCPSAGFLSVLNSAGSALLWSTYLGSGTVNAIALDARGNVYATGTGIDINGATVPLSPGNSIGVVKIAPQGAPVQFSVNGITNAASFISGLPEAGGLASIFVHGLSVSGIVQASGTPLPTELDGVSVFVDGIAAPMLAVANLPVANPVGMQQINFQVPFEVNSQAYSGTPNLVEVRFKGVSTFAFPQPVTSGIFVLPDGSPAIQHGADYSPVTPSNPAKKNEVIIIYATGLGRLISGEPADGKPATGPAPAACPPLASVGTVLYAGLTPGYVGLYQLNVRVAPSMPSGNVDLYFKSTCVPWFGTPPQNLAQSNTVKLPVQ